MSRSPTSSRPSARTSTEQPSHGFVAWGLVPRTVDRLANAGDKPPRYDDIRGSAGDLIQQALLDVRHGAPDSGLEVLPRALSAALGDPVDVAGFDLERRQRPADV